MQSCQNRILPFEAPFEVQKNVVNIHSELTSRGGRKPIYWRNAECFTFRNILMTECITFVVNHRFQKEFNQIVSFQLVGMMIPYSVDGNRCSFKVSILLLIHCFPPAYENRYWFKWACFDQLQKLFSSLWRLETDVCSFFCITKSNVYDFISKERKIILIL